MLSAAAFSAWLFANTRQHDGAFSVSTVIDVPATRSSSACESSTLAVMAVS